MDGRNKVGINIWYRCEAESEIVRPEVDEVGFSYLTCPWGDGHPGIQESNYLVGKKHPGGCGCPGTMTRDQ